MRPDPRTAPAQAHVRRFLVAGLLAASWSACGGDDGPAAVPALPAQLPTLRHDFGTIPHGAAAQHDFVLDTRTAIGPEYVAVGVQADCSCAKTQMLLRDEQGRERAITGQAFAEYAPREGEVLVIRVQIDTAQKEAADLPPVDSKASVVLQDSSSPDPYARVGWPLLFHFAVDSPVSLQPHAVLDFGRVPASRRPTLVTTIRGDRQEPLRLRPPQSDDPRLALTLEPADGFWTLRATFTPDQRLGTFRSLVRIPTDLEGGYVVQLAAVGKIVPDLEATPMGKISLRTDLRREQSRERASSQYLVVSDHDVERNPEFTVARLVDAAGRDASGSFEVWFEPVPGDDRSRRMFVRYRGGIDDDRGFRGELVLAKDPHEGPFLPIELVAFHVPEP